MHLSEGDLQSYLDGELASDRSQQLAVHLEACAVCQARAASQAARREAVSGHLEALAPRPGFQPLARRAARLRLDDRLNQTLMKEKEPMIRKLFTRQYRPAWVAVAIVLILAISLTFAPVRTLANSFLGLFRVEQVSVVEFDADGMQARLGNTGEFEALMSEVTFEGGGEPREVASPEEAAQAAGFSIRLPQNIDGDLSLGVTPGGKATYTVDVERLRALMDVVDLKGIEIPDAINGATITVEIPTSVLTQWGECEMTPEKVREAGFDPDASETWAMPQCTFLMQMPSPTIQAPPGLNLQAFGEAYLQLLGMSREQASDFAQKIDWATTFVIPVPRYQATYEAVLVDGVSGTLIRPVNPDQSGEYFLVWVKDGILFTLASQGDIASAVEIADSLK